MREDVRTRRVDVHVHYLPGALVEAYGKRNELPRLVTGDAGRLVEMGAGLAYPLFPVMLDARLRLTEMAEHGIAASLVTVPPPGLDGFPGAEAAAVARSCNDELAELDPARLPGVAVLPLQAPAAAADELDRAVRRGLRAGLLYTNVAGAQLDEPRFRPIFEAAADLGVPLLLHPTTPAGVSAASGWALTTTLGFLVETAVCTLRLTLDGLFERHPELALVVPHAGSVLPAMLGRIDYEAALLPGAAGAVDGPPSARLRGLYVDTVCAWPPALRLAVEVFGTERIMFGSDSPFWRVGDGVATLEALVLDEPIAAQLWHGNADRLFGL